MVVGKRILEKEADKLVIMTNAKTNINQHLQLRRPRFSGRRAVLTLITALVVALTMMATVADTLWAAIELAYYRGAATNNAVFLEWATVREVNINGFEILCKRVNDPDTSFHPIGSRIALGSATSGATYNFDVTSGLIPGERYCFRLREITTDDTPGEAFDLCGYGLGLTPPPTTVSVEVSIPVTLTPTAVTVTQVPGVDAAPTLAPTVDPFATATPTIDPFLTPTPTVDPFATATFTPLPTVANQGDSPLPTPTETATVTSEPTVQQQNLDPAQAELSPESPITEPTATPTETPTATEMPTEMPTATDIPTATATLTNSVPVSVSQVGGVPAVDANGQPVITDNAPANGAALAVEEATATPIYLVVTATPTPLPAIVVAPTFTPWPTAVPTETFGLSNLLVPSTQNLMVGLLCLIFVSASGLGALGLVTSVLYMRSQSRRDRLPGPGQYYDRRRY